VQGARLAVTAGDMVEASEEVRILAIVLEGSQSSKACGTL